MGPYSNLGVNRPISYNKPSKRQALLGIRRLIVDEGLSHNEIQLRLNLSSSVIPFIHRPCHSCHYRRRSPYCHY